VWGSEEGQDKAGQGRAGQRGTGRESEWVFDGCQRQFQCVSLSHSLSFSLCVCVHLGVKEEPQEGVEHPPQGYGDQSLDLTPCEVKE
jgi:hypothetical protein